MPPANSVNIDQSGIHPTQPVLFALGDVSRGAMELYPAVWGELEKLIMGEESIRLDALNKLAEMDVARFSPLVIFLLTTKLTDVSLLVRSRTVELISSILSPDKDGNLTPEDVLECLKSCLAQMRTRQVYAVLQVLHTRPDLLLQASRLLNYCPYAGNHLTDVASSRQAPMEIRRMAILLIGEVGYLDALPALERLLSRLESRLNGQHAMPFAPQVGAEDTSLIPEINQAMTLLRTP